MIHKTAVIGKKAEIDSSVVIGPYSIIDDDVKPKIKQGVEVEYWKVLDRTKVVRVKN